MSPSENPIKELALGPLRDAKEAGIDIVKQLTWKPITDIMSWSLNSMKAVLWSPFKLAGKAIGNAEVIPWVK